MVRAKKIWKNDRIFLKPAKQMTGTRKQRFSCACYRSSSHNLIRCPQIGIKEGCFERTTSPQIPLLLFCTCQPKKPIFHKFFFVKEYRRTTTSFQFDFSKTVPSHLIDTLAGALHSRPLYTFLIEQQALPYAFRVP